MPSALIFYHFFHPDDVVSSLHKNGLAEGLAKRGWEVEAMPCNRGCRDQTKTYPKSGSLGKIKISRIWRPKFNQAGTGLSRLINAVWMITLWSFKVFSRKPDVLIIGTDPVLSILTAIPWKIIRPKTKIAHWCFDLYPEGAIAEGIIKPHSLTEKIIKYFCGAAYRKCDLIVDLGDCMRERLQKYSDVDKIKNITLIPWALAEPKTALKTDPQERELIGNEKLVLIYSGNLGRFHSYNNIIKLARALRNKDVIFVFSVRGNAVDKLKSEISSDDTNIRFVDFAPLEKLQERLSAADIHIVSLKEEWTGLAIPSKFFGAIAAGRPILFSGSPNCAISKWIEQYQLGWVLNDENIETVAENISELLNNSNSLNTMFPHCHDIYQKYFSEEYINDQWDENLRKMLPQGST